MGGDRQMSDQLTEMIQPVVEGFGCELWGIEQLSRGRNSLLKIYIDSEEGINVDDCARVSRQISMLLDVEDPVKGEYTLEVSSPGMDRRLFRLEQFESFAGALVRVQLRRPFDGQRKFSGRLRGIEGDEVVLVLDEEEVLFPFETIERANVVPEY